MTHLVSVGNEDMMHFVDDRDLFSIHYVYKIIYICKSYAIPQTYKFSGVCN